MADIVNEFLNGVRTDFYQNMENQLLNQFEVIIVPHENVILNSTVGLDPLGSASLLTLLENTLIGNFYVQSVVIPGTTFDFVRQGNKQYVTDVTYPETCSMTFIEDGNSTVQRYLAHWQDEVHQMNSIDLINTPNIIKQMVNTIRNGSSVDPDNALAQKFQTDPGLAKKNAFIIPQQRNGNASALWYNLNGLVIKSIDDITFGQSEGDPMYITVSFAIDSVRNIKPF